MKNNKAESELFKHALKMHLPLCVFNYLNIFSCLKAFNKPSIYLGFTDISYNKIVGHLLYFRRVNI